MAGICVVCTHHPIPEDKSRSFHRFPSKHESKQKWLDILKLNKITTKSRVCSDHFDISCFHDTDGYTSLRRLKSTAIPTLRLRDEVDVGSQDFVEVGTPQDADTTSVLSNETQRRDVTENVQGVTPGSITTHSTTLPTNILETSYTASRSVTPESPIISTSETVTGTTVPKDSATLSDGAGGGSDRDTIPTDPPIKKKKPTRKLLKRDVTPINHDDVSRESSMGESGQESSSEELNNEYDSDGNRILKRTSESMLYKFSEKK
ncbi:hypothetical protein QAD02_019533 [Eretmocerus hayati]|uniref:Uncharacterized protein n=1 Tax=Eretmocerus hayati TaxID=131215 RepID=A0ACC2PLN7_9HYME|nr:hypothetical protein QAD02_019533 [Eretmocerus hayati]